MTAVNFAVALAVPRLTRRVAVRSLLAAGVSLTLVGMAWLSRAGVSEGYLVAVALPMLLIGVGQGLAFAPLTASASPASRAEDAGAASGLVNTAHQLGMALGLGILVTISVQTGGLGGAAAVTAHVSTALTGSAVLLAMALLVVALVIVPVRRTLSAEPVTTTLAKEAAA